jgi:Spy/CpxP family protein refolding chaperone
MKKFNKGSMLLLVALVLVLGLMAYAWAQPMGMGMGKGRGHGPGAMMNLTPEQGGKLFDLKEKFHADTAGLRKDLLIKRLEMKALWKAENPDQNAILAKQKEINGLRDQMTLKMVTFRLEAKKIAPQGHMGMGRHMSMGMGEGEGCGMGPGMEHAMCMEMGPMGPGAVPPPAPPAK